MRFGADCKSKYEVLSLKIQDWFEPYLSNLIWFISKISFNEEKSESGLWTL